MLASTAGSPLAGQNGSARNLPPAGDMQLARALLEQLIEIDTTDTERGDNTRAAQAMADALLDAGLPPEDVQVLVPDDFPTKGNLVARLRGKNPNAAPILLLAHIDVVEALPEDWSPGIHPFEFMERDGYFYGRGTSDDKDECAIHTANLIRLHREGFVPDRDIVIALTADEEGGTRNGVQFLLEEHRELIDAAFALNEGGGGMEREGRRVSNNVQGAEKVVPVLRLCGQESRRPFVAAGEEERDLRTVSGAARGPGVRVPGHAERSDRRVLRSLGRADRRRDR